ncbi:MAG: cytochrome c biogenesis protein CcsA [Phycisphaerae bacterium]|nr:cytochrome c biogenesis protein CcsA [Phycisphaerae bacterium]
MTQAISTARRGIPLWWRVLIFVAVVAAVLVLWPSRAMGQTAPAGNEHPGVSMVDTHQGAIMPPFGMYLRETRFDAGSKHEFAGKVDLSALRDVPVFHGGRVKIMDTLARETIAAICGRSDYFEVVDGQKVAYDPLFTLMDLMIDPAFYIDRPLLHVNYINLRDLFLERAIPGEDAASQGERARWRKLTRISPAMYQRHVNEIASKFSGEKDAAAYHEAIDQVERALALVDRSGANMDVVAPAGTDLPWNHITRLPENHPARAAAVALGAAWRAGDAAGVNASIVALRDELAKVSPGVYPSTRRTLELTYNRLNAFEWGLWLYVAAFVAFLLAFGTGRSWLTVLAMVFLVPALAMHAGGFLLRCLIAERFAIQNQFESMTGVSLFAAVVGVSIAAVRKQWIYAAGAAGVGFLVLITATQTRIPGATIEREAAILNTSVLLKYHVTTVLTSYGLIALGFINSVFYLVTHYLAPKAALATAGGGVVAGNGGSIGGGAPAGRARVLHDLDRAQMTVLQLAFWTLGVGILLGAWWADHSWGRWWAFDPKETWALVTWIMYLIVIHLRMTGVKNKALATAWMSVVGFIVMIWTYFGVNLLLPGLHAYA